MDGMTTPTAKSARLDFRVTAEQKATIEEAAAIEGRSLTGGMPASVPIVLLGRLAVDREFAGRGLGVSLLQHATVRALEAADAIGVRAILVHAINDDVVAFYERFGFTVFPDARRTLYLLTKDARATLLR